MKFSTRLLGTYLYRHYYVAKYVHTDLVILKECSKQLHKIQIQWQPRQHVAVRCVFTLQKLELCAWWNVLHYTWTFPQENEYIYIKIWRQILNRFFHYNRSFSSSKKTSYFWRVWLWWATINYLKLSSCIQGSGWPMGNFSTVWVTVRPFNSVDIVTVYSSSLEVILSNATSYRKPFSWLESCQKKKKKNSV